MDTASTSASMACVSATPDEHGHVPVGACGAIWPYHPSFDSNLAIMIIFAVLTLAHAVQGIWFRQRFCWVITMAGIWETAAFALRTLGARFGQVIPYYVLSTILFILAPLWINAFIFMLASRVVRRGLPGTRVWNIDARWLTKLFVGADIICFVVQAGGSSLMSSTSKNKLADVEDKKKLGQTIYLIGCGLQLGFIILFGILMSRVLVHVRQQERCNKCLKTIKLLLLLVFTVLILIMIRLVFRLAEFGPGITADNHLISSEIYALALDAAPMIVALALINIFHPGLFLSEKGNPLFKGETYALETIES